MSNNLLQQVAGLFRRGAGRKQDLATPAQALLSGRGEASGVALARELLAEYARLSDANRLAFLLMLADRLGVDKTRLEKAIAHYQADPSARTAMGLHNAAEPRRQELIRRLNLAPGGTASLVRMRENLLREIGAHPDLKMVDADFAHLFSSWFNRGFLVLRRIDWSTPAAILEKIIHYEAVHEITSWDDLRRRLQPEDRRCFAFFHPALQDEPLIFVEVALTDAIPDAIAPLLASGRTALEAKRARTAVFYSISNCQAGLKGVSFGNFLIKQVAEELKRELPSLKTFVTLSPVPQFGQWLREQREAKTSVLDADAKSTLKLMDQAAWETRNPDQKALRPVLQAALAHYFLLARTESGKPVDHVARFHLNNGARLERIDWLGDVSPKGIAQAAGFMVNYLYDLDQIEENHEAFANLGEVRASAQVRALIARKPRNAKSSLETTAE